MITRLNWEQLREDSELQNKYAVTISNHFVALSQDESCKTPQNCYDQLEKCLDAANHQLLEEVGRVKTRLFSECSDRLRRRRNKAMTCSIGARQYLIVLTGKV